MLSRGRGSAKAGGVASHSPASVLEERPHVGAAVTALPAGELGLQIESPNVVTPSPGVDHDRMRALLIGTVVDDPGRARLPHFSQGDFLNALHAPIPRIISGLNRQFRWVIEIASKALRSNTC